MSIHFQRELDKLKKGLLTLSALVEENLRVAIQAVATGDIEIAKSICEKDIQVDQMEVEVEEECLKILALYQPVASDLRFVIVVLKINNDLERVGDLAANIANKVKRTCTDESVPIPFDFEQMFNQVQAMLKQSMDALIHADTSLAHAVCKADDTVDTMKREVREQVLSAMKENPDQIRALYATFGIARNLERIADLATNIAEDVIYMAEGSIIRHQKGSAN